MGHSGAGVALPWHEAMKLPGSKDMKYMVDMFSSLEWWKLIPAQELLIEQPGADDPHRFVMVAKAKDDSWALAYLPEGTEINLRTEVLNRVVAIRWFNPRTGEWLDAQKIGDGVKSFTAPDSEDWVLWIGAAE